MTYETENDAEAAEKAAFIKTAFEGLNDPGDDNASRVKAGDEPFSKVDTSAEAHPIETIARKRLRRLVLLAKLRAKMRSPSPLSRARRNSPARAFMCSRSPLARRSRR